LETSLILVPSFPVATDCSAPAAIASACPVDTVLVGGYCKIDITGGTLVVVTYLANNFSTVDIATGSELTLNCSNTTCTDNSTEFDLTAVAICLVNGP